jgi:hypothetical protein
MISPYRTDEVNLAHIHVVYGDTSVAAQDQRCIIMLIAATKA